MFRYYYFFLLSFLITSCKQLAKQEQNNNDKIVTNRNKPEYYPDTTWDKLEYYPEVKSILNNKNFVSHNNYYLLSLQDSDGVNISWGNDTLIRTLPEKRSFNVAGKMHLAWSNNHYLILRYSMGSGVSGNIVLPINKTEDTQYFDNVLCFDSLANIIGVEQQGGDTILFAQNLKTGRKEFITDGGRHCTAAFFSSCIDSIGIKNKELYLVWAIPDNFEDNKKVYKRRIHLNL
ncbi:MAG TPA: hypothetical protein VK483_03295 [Chitinophagaceae bacterium]|nr:hypothetical protein [Chitinophagaceae bacterium]